MKYRKNKKAQMKIQEMSFMLLALVLFFIIVGLFWLNLSSAGLKRGFAELQEQKTISTMVRLADSPELGCGSGERLCIDMDKVLAMKNNPSFEKYWEIDGLVIKRIYPYSNKTVECSFGSYGACNTFTLKQPSADSSAVSSFVSLCRKESQSGYWYDKCELGLLLAYIEK